MIFDKQEKFSQCDINYKFYMQGKTFIVNNNLQGKTFVMKNIIKLKFFIK